MGGTERLAVPKFLEGEMLPPGGNYDPPNPNINPPTCKMDLSGLLAYMVANGRKERMGTDKGRNEAV